MPKSVDFHQTNGHNSSAVASMCHLVIFIPRRLAYKRSNSQQISFSHYILPSNHTKSRVHSKSKEAKSDLSNPEIHVYRNGISDTTEHSQGTNRLHRFSSSDYQNNFFSDSCFYKNLAFYFGQTQCSSRLRSPRLTSFTTASDVSSICLETSHSPSQSSGFDQQHDSIPFEMVEGHQLLRSGNVHSSPRSQCIPFYGCQSLRMGSR